MNGRRIPLVIPAYEPDSRFPVLVKKLVEQGFERIVVVDDGSGENYREVFSEVSSYPQVELLVHEVNKGKGAALKTAFRHILDSTQDLLGCVTADSDGQHSPSSILSCIQALEKNPEKLVMGVRDFTRPDVPVKSVIGNRNTNKIINGIFKTNLTDTQTGLRGLPASFMKECLSLKGDRFQFEIQMLSLALSKGRKIEEVPIETIYDSKTEHVTHFRPIHDTLSLYWTIGIFRSLWFLLFS